AEKRALTPFPLVARCYNCGLLVGHRGKIRRPPARPNCRSSGSRSAGDRRPHGAASNHHVTHQRIWAGVLVFGCQRANDGLAEAPADAVGADTEERKMPIGLVGRKCGMTRIFTESGDSVPVTVIGALPNRVTTLKTPERDG